MIDSKDLSAAAPFLSGGTKCLLIDGKLVQSRMGRTFETYNPTSGEVLARVYEADELDIDDAVAAARSAFEGVWSKFTPYDRQNLLLKLAELVDSRFDELSLIDTLNMGAPITRTSGGRRRMVGLLRYYAGLATSLHGLNISNSAGEAYFSYTRREPIGVVGAITPWNGPLGLAIWKIAPVLATGCTVVHKPAEQAPLSALLFGELCLEAGVPPGVVNVVPGPGEAGAALARHPGVDKLAFTGSTEVGQQIVRASASNMKRLSMELGGKSPNIVFRDADLNEAVPGAAMAVFSNSGQICSAGTRMFVERPIYDEFLARISKFAASLRVGDPINRDTQLGPLVSPTQLKRVEKYVSEGVGDGAKLLCGGRKIQESALSNGNFIEPTIFGDVADGSVISREEIFGPVIVAMPFDTLEEVIERGNDTKYGLGGGVWTRDIRNAQVVSHGLRAGTVWINCYQIMDPAVPFGGYKMSGYGRESGEEHLDEYLQTKAVWMKGAGPLVSA